MFLGELALGWSAAPHERILSMTAVAKEEGFLRVFVPESNAPEAALVEDIEVIPVRTLAQAVAHLRGEEQILPWSRRVAPVDGHAFEVEDASTNGVGHVGGADLADIRGQEHAKRALEVAAAGGHNLLMSGPPGSGKTLLARSMPSIMPSLTNNEALEVTKIYGVSGLLAVVVAAHQLPALPRAPQTISNADSWAEVPFPSRARSPSVPWRAFLPDELRSSGTTVLEVLRQPIEDKIVTIRRSEGQHTYPRNFILVGAMNPCPCGYYPTRRRNGLQRLAGQPSKDESAGRCSTASTCL